MRTITRFNPSGESAIFLVPGIAAYVLAMVAVLSGFVFPIENMPTALQWISRVGCG